MRQARTPRSPFPLHRHRLSPSLPPPSEYAHPYVQVLLGILANVANQSPELACRAVHVLIYLLVLEKLSRCSAALLQIGGQLVDAFGDRIEPFVVLLIG